MPSSHFCLSTPIDLISDCPSNLKEAIDWILRVTGKDGQDTSQQGQQAIKALSTQVKELLEKVKGADTGLSAQMDKVIGALDNGSGNTGLIGKLADGHQQIIGYNGKTFSGVNTTGQITGAGIAPSNMATHRLCDATIAFTIGVLEECKGKTDSQYRGRIDGVIKTLHGKYGTGTKGLKEVATKVQSELKQVNGSNVRGFVQQIGGAFHTYLNNLSKDSAQNVAQKVGEYLNSVLKGNSNWTKTSGVDGKLQQLVTGDNNTYDANKLGNKIGDVEKTIRTKVGGRIDYLTPVLQAGKRAFIWQLQKRNYESRYKGVSIDNINASTHAKIFLSCLPLIFNNLSYFYWQCRDGGQWQNQNLTGGSLSPFMEVNWFRNSYMNENMTGTIVVKNVMNARFPELQTAASATQHKSYSDFLKSFRSKGEQTWKGAPQISDTNYLSGLYILCSCYFQCQQIKSAEKTSRGPKTIREMLYFLAALQFSPQYDEFDRYVTSHFKTLLGKQSEDSTADSELKLQVADSGKTSQGTDTLSAADLKSHLASTFLLPPAFISVIQGPGDSKDPWLHSLFSNSQFNLSIPSSGTGLFNALSNYAYALQFQLSFLYIQCRNTYTVECGWRDCRFGKDINNGVKTPVLSHICNGYECKDATCQHKGSNTSCTHNKYDDTTNSCGQGSPSPLQAFLTDQLRGFSRGHPSDPSSHLATCSGPMCHVPMGFSRALTKDPNATGWYIYYLLDHFCSRPYSPLRQLCEKLGCLTKRTPMTLGDVFGFIWTLNYQLFNNAEILNKLKEALSSNHYSVQDFMEKLKQSVPTLKPSPENSGLVKSLQTMAPVIPFLYQLFRINTDDFLPVTLFNLAQHCHKWDSNQYKHESHLSGQPCPNPNDLWSLYQPVSAAPIGGGTTDSQSACRNAQCGGYLSPLTHSAGATYAPVHASVYLSWLAYLTDDFHEWFQNLLDEFQNIDCSKTGCSKPSASACNHYAGQHGSDQSCSCDSVVHCGGVLPLLYRYGFTFHNAYSLKGGMHGSDQTKRSCQQFHDQLSAVLAHSENTPLFKLLTTIDDFLYLFRFYFVYNLFTFWIMYLCIVLYIYFLRVDLLHIRSHMHLPSSHSVAPIAPLTTGKAADLTKLKYFIS
ncbi:variant erythrocyte surface antigen-1 family protein [Babesia caballi]|uniref:Variant erythrocyte surface antigen-1 family protein n=1 Tax=Babesia caballi TaxID=5871 RepID=A0AAV4LTS2_BABCB|nr:variant erythrocyte surface antigen-1 family protein [Babesia caballi]